MILMKIIFVCLIVLPFFIFSLYLVRYTYKALSASKKRDRVQNYQSQASTRKDRFR